MSDPRSHSSRRGSGSSMDASIYTAAASSSAFLAPGAEAGDAVGAMPGTNIVSSGMVGGSAAEDDADKLPSLGAETCTAQTLSSRHHSAGGGRRQSCTLDKALPDLPPSHPTAAGVAFMDPHATPSAAPEPSASAPASSSSASASASASASGAASSGASIAEASSSRPIRAFELVHSGPSLGLAGLAADGAAPPTPELVSSPTSRLAPAVAEAGAARSEEPARPSTASTSYASALDGGFTDSSPAPSPALTLGTRQELHAFALAALDELNPAEHIETSLGFAPLAAIGARAHAHRRRTHSAPSTPALSEPGDAFADRSFGEASSSSRDAHGRGLARSDAIIQKGFVPIPTSPEVDADATPEATSETPSAKPAAEMLCLPLFSGSDRAAAAAASSVPLPATMPRGKFPARPPLHRSGVLPGSSSALGLAFPGWANAHAARVASAAAQLAASSAAVSDVSAKASRDSPLAPASGVTVERARSDKSHASQRSGVTAVSASGESASTAESAVSGASLLLSGSVPSASASAITTPATGSWVDDAQSPFADFGAAAAAKLAAKSAATEVGAAGPRAQLSIQTDTAATSGASSMASSPVHTVGPTLGALFDKQAQRRLRLYHALMELVETERSYADDLAILVLVFLENLQRMPFFDQVGDPAERAWRIETVSRNAEQILRLHQQIAVRLETIVARNGLTLASGATPGDSPLTLEEEMQKALSENLDIAVVHIARYFVSIAPMLSLYEIYCSKHSEALGLIHEAEKRQADWQAFEAHCTEIIRWQSEAKAKRTSRSRQSSSVNVNVLPNAAPPSPVRPLVALPSEQRAGSVGGSQSTAPRSRSPGSSQLLLHFHDFFVKPVQRIVLYRLVLGTLVKHAAGFDILQVELEEALEAVKLAADRVDDAGKKREQELLAEMLIWRMASHYSISQASLRALGPVLLAGPLHALHHHPVHAPLEAPLRFKYYGVVVFNGWILFAKVRKSGAYEPRHFFPLWSAKLTITNDETEALVPHSFRLSVKGHHFELVACSSKERELWTSTIGSAIQSAPCSPSGDEATSFPSSLPLDEVNIAGVSSDLSSPALSVSESDPMGLFLASLSTGEVSPVGPASGTNGTAASRSSKPLPVPPKSVGLSTPAAATFAVNPALLSELLVRINTPAQCAAFDRCMIISAHCVAVHFPSTSMRDAVTTPSANPQWLTTTSSGIGATVGAAIGLNRLSSSSNVGSSRLQRRKSMVEVSITTPSPKIRVLDVPSRSVTSVTSIEPEERSPLDGWKNTFRKKAGSRSRPASVIGVAIGNLQPGSASLPTSTMNTPVLELQEFPIHEEPHEIEPESSPSASAALAAAAAAAAMPAPLRRANSRSFAGTVREVFANSMGTRPRASTLFLEGQAVQADLTSPPAVNEFGSSAAPPEETTRRRTMSLRRALSFRRSGSTSSTTSSQGTPTEAPSPDPTRIFSGSETLRTLRARASKTFSRVDMAFTQSTASAPSSIGRERTPSSGTPSNASSTEDIRGAAALMERASTDASAPAQTTQRRRLNRLFVQSNRFSPLSTESTTPARAS